MKLVTFLNLELISAVLFAIVVLVGSTGAVRALVLTGIVIFMIVVLAYYLREIKRAPEQRKY